MENSYDIFDSAIRHVLNGFHVEASIYEDVYQECYCEILTVLKNNSYDPIMNLYGYAFRIARNTLTKYTYHHKKLVTLADEEDLRLFDAIPDTADLPDQRLEFTNSLTTILNKFNTLFNESITEAELLSLIQLPDSEIPQNKLKILKGETLWTLAKQN